VGNTAEIIAPGLATSLASEQVSPQVYRRQRVDKIARFVVTGGGFLVIASIFSILLVILWEAFPLFFPADAKLSQQFPVSSSDKHPDHIGIDASGEQAFSVGRGLVSFYDTASGSQLATLPLLEPKLGSIKATFFNSANDAVLQTSSNKFHHLLIGFGESFNGKERVLTPQITVSDPTPLFLAPEEEIAELAFSQAEEGLAIAYVGSTNILRLFRQIESYSLLGDGELETQLLELPLPAQKRISAISIDSVGENIFLGTQDGQVLHVFTEDEQLVLGTSIDRLGGEVTTMSLLVGAQTLVVGRADGRVSSFFLVRNKGNGEKELKEVNEFQQHLTSVRKVAPSARNRVFATLSDTGSIHLNFATTGETFLEIGDESSQFRDLSFSEKGDRLLTVGQDHGKQVWDIDNPHPETTVKSLFGRVWYEGYDSPSFVWQSTGGTDAFEPKLSMVPLIFGTLKGTFYALLFAVPLAVFAALYTSEFMHPRLRGFIKPSVELMAALPSVVIGFIAGLWLAPAIEPYVTGVLLTPVVVVALSFAFFALWSVFPNKVTSLVPDGMEVLLLVPVVALAAWLSFGFGDFIEQYAMGGDFTQWVRETLGLTYDQRNSLVVGLAMGLAVIPIIFTISEDALSSVPNGIKSGSLALGASPWQTALLVVLPAASPGIFSAIMIGLGRAVGETMIVLMATGNTPIMDYSIFDGFRALSANIAVELPEAPHGGTLYRVLFLSALLLFVFTFVINSLTELLRLKLRKKHGQA
jgi:phosphate transport system permease protein